MRKILIVLVELYAIILQTFAVDQKSNTETLNVITRPWIAGAPILSFLNI